MAVDLEVLNRQDAKNYLAFGGFLSFFVSTLLLSQSNCYVIAGAGTFWVDGGILVNFG